MNKYSISVSLFSILAVSTALADTFTFNGKEITVPVPEGFVRITDEMTGVSKLVEHMADPMNDTLAYYIAEADVPVAMTGEIPDLDRTFLLKVNKQLRNQVVGKDDFSQIKEMAKTQNQVILENVKAQLPDLMQDMSQGVSQEFDVDFALNISQMVPFEPHYEAENAMAYSMYVNIGVTEGDETEERVISATSTFLNASGVVLFLYGYAPQADLEWTRDASMSWAESVMASNSQPPAKSLGGRGFDWMRVMEMAVMGGITGGLAVLVIAFSKRKKS